jgi:hypothetical protein
MPKRGRPPGSNPKKVWAILQVLQNYPDGVWLRQLATEAKLPVATVSYYIDHVFSPFVDNVGFRRPDGKYIGLRVIRLKPGKKAVTIKEIMNYQKVRASIDEPIQAALIPKTSS